MAKHSFRHRQVNDDCPRGLMIGVPKMLSGRLQKAKVLGEAPSPQRVKLDEPGKGADIALILLRF